MIIEIEEMKEDNSEEVYKKLFEEFNKIAKENKSKFRIELGTHCFLIKKNNLNFGNLLGDCDIYYHKDDKEEYFYFLNGIDKETFEEVKPLLEKIQITSKFKIRTIE